MYFLFCRQHYALLLTTMRKPHFLLLVMYLIFSVYIHGQKITLSLSNAPLEKAFSEIKKQTGYTFVYTREQLAKTSPVTLQSQQAPLRSVLDQCLSNQPLKYSIDGNYIVIQNRETETQPEEKAIPPISGKVVDQSGNPLANVTIIAKKSKITGISNERGLFTLREVATDDILIITRIGYRPQEIPVNHQSYFNIIMEQLISELDETIVMAYGTTSRRLNTGNIGKVTSQQIETQPVLNPLAAMQGRIPGLVITQTSGVSGSAFNVEIRGRTVLDKSISGNDPLFIIDGVPFAPGNTSISQIRSAANDPRESSTGGMSPFAYINPSDIESIEVLKDADATSIYGSRGANGVVLITTKKGVQGDLKIVADVSYGQSKINRHIDMLNTQQYLALRREAFNNDGVTPTTSNAPDLLVWDTTQYTNFEKLLIGGAESSADARISLSGGSLQTKFLLSGAWHRNTSVYPGNFSNTRISTHVGLNHRTKNDKFDISFQALYSTGKNNLLSTDLTNYIALPPDLPALKDSLGNLNWSTDGFDYTNPLAELLRTYNTENDNLSANAVLNYYVLRNLVLRVSGGYNLFNSNESSFNPLASINPASGSLAFSTWAASKAKSWIIEPQAEYTAQFHKHKLDVLIGTTWQQQDNSGTYIDARNYTSDLLLKTVSAAPQLNASNTFRRYRYDAFFGRIAYNYLNKYLVNLSGRRDASSRFGSGHRIGDFGAIGAGWIFSDEPWLYKNKWLSFGKLRMSYGVTGNDQVGDYKFLDNWKNAALTYQDIVGLQPAQLYNPDYSWETNRKWETGADIGLYKDRLFITAAYFINRSSNRLINYTLPTQTGFSSVLQNWDASVENKGWEITLSAKSKKTQALGWDVDLNITLPKNKLVSFPGLSQSSYKFTYIEGYSLSVINTYEYLGVDPKTGVYRFKDVDSNNIMNSLDYQVLGNKDPKYYGGLHIGLQFKKWQLDFLAEFRKQVGYTLLNNQSSYIPGYSFANQSTLSLNRWPHDLNNPYYQRATRTAGSDAYIAAVITLPTSNAIYGDASFIRGKNLALSYNLKLPKIKDVAGKIYIQGQNLFTITNYRGADPENQNLYMLPPLRTIVCGLQLTF